MHKDVRDRGYTLTEVVISIALVAVVVLPVLAAVRTAVRTSSFSREAAELETLIVNIADRVNRAPVICDSYDPYYAYAEAAVVTNGWDPAVVLPPLKYAYYAPTPKDPADREYQSPGIKDWYPSAAPCPIGGTSNGKRVVQRVTITLRSPNHAISRSIEVLKSDV